MSDSAPRRANVELKARYPDRAKGEEACRRLGARLVGTERQTDTYFSTGSYRMKLRESSLGNHYLIWYHRPDRAGSRRSTYRLTPVPDPGAKARILSQAMGVKVVVRKERTLYLLGAVRIHLDRVEGLGDFLEFEAVLEDGAEEAEAHAQVEFLRREMGVGDEDLIEGSYSDLVSAESLT